MNYQIIYCAIMLFVLCLIGGIGDSIWLNMRNFIDGTT